MNNTQNIVVLDTNVFLYDPYALFRFDGKKIIVPMLVLEELDGIKVERNDAGRNARTAVKVIEQISKLGSLAQGIEISHENCGFITKQDNKFYSVVSVVQNIGSLDKKNADFFAENNDNKLLAVCQNLFAQSPDVTLITRDVNLRIKARAVGINADDFDHHSFNQANFKGYREEYLDSEDLKFLTAKNLAEKLQLKTDALENNEFVAAISRDNPSRYKIFKFKKDSGFKEVENYFDMWGFGAKNVAQAVALNLLLDDSIPLVFLVGPAGTGKTLLTLLAGLYKVVNERMYDKMFIARPLISLGADIGFIPGDLQEKLFHWMHPFYDNLEYVFRDIDMRGEEFTIFPKRQDLKSMLMKRDGSRFGSKHKKRSYNQNDEFAPMLSNAHQTVATLQNNGMISLEAITHMRGRSIPNQYIFIDEVQNLTPAEVKTIITRAGEGTKIIMAGDPYQIDSTNMDFYNNGLVTSLVKLRGDALVGCLFMEESQRSEIAKVGIAKL